MSDDYAHADTEVVVLHCNEPLCRAYISGPLDMLDKFVAAHGWVYQQGIGWCSQHAAPHRKVDSDKLLGLFDELNRGIDRLSYRIDRIETEVRDLLASQDSTEDNATRVIVAHGLKVDRARYIHIDQPEHGDDEVCHYKVPTWVLPGDILLITYKGYVLVSMVTDGQEAGSIVSISYEPWKSGGLTFDKDSSKFDIEAPPGWTIVDHVTALPPYGPKGRSH